MAYLLGWVDSQGDGEVQVVGMGFIGRAHGITVLEDAANQWFQFGIDILLEEFPQIFDLIRGDFFDHAADAPLTFVDDAFDVLFLLIALNHGKHGSGEHFAQVAQGQLRGLLGCFG